MCCEYKNVFMIHKYIQTRACMSCPLQVLRRQLYNIYHRKISVVVRSVHLGPTPKRPKQKGRAPQDLLGLDLDADPRRRDLPNHLVATNSSPSCGMDDRFASMDQNFRDSRWKLQIFEIDVPYPNFMFRFHVRSTRVPSEKQTWQAGKNYIEVIEAISATKCCLFHWEMVPDFWTHIARNRQNRIRWECKPAENLKESFVGRP